MTILHLVNRWLSREARWVVSLPPTLLTRLSLRRNGMSELLFPAAMETGRTFWTTVLILCCLVRYISTLRVRDSQTLHVYSQRPKEHFEFSCRAG